MFDVVLCFVSAAADHQHVRGPRFIVEGQMKVVKNHIYPQIDFTILFAAYLTKTAT